MWEGHVCILIQIRRGVHHPCGPCRQHANHIWIHLWSLPKLIKAGLVEYFKLKDLGKVKFLLGIEVVCNRKAGTIKLSQQAYIEQLLKCFNLEDVKSATTPLLSGVQLMQDNCPVTDEDKRGMANIPYASLIGALMYATIGTRPDIAFAVGALSRFLSYPGRHHWNEAKCTLCYLKDTVSHAICYRSTASPSEAAVGHSCGVGIQPTGSIKGLCDSNWAGCVNTQRSTSGFVWMMSEEQYAGGASYNQ